MDTIEFKESLEEQSERKIYKYTCPICWRYFKQILATECCKNYLCHFCADDFQKRCSQLGISSHCHLCNRENLRLKDVCPTDPIKRYSDTPISTMKSNQMLIAFQTFKKKEEEANSQLSNSQQLNIDQNISALNNNNNNNKNNNNNANNQKFLSSTLQNQNNENLFLYDQKEQQFLSQSDHMNNFKSKNQFYQTERIEQQAEEEEQSINTSTQKYQSNIQNQSNAANNLEYSDDSDLNDRISSKELDQIDESKEISQN